MLPSASVSSLVLSGDGEVDRLGDVDLLVSGDIILLRAIGASTSTLTLALATSTDGLLATA